ncbi:uncharacterized protein LOC141588401 [Silene latifolia]|uniref:uncharacterized protein LOC141588401 n=1 Tax=Silene latifolia TaxID=37657 RepID=UPI003D7831C6
MKEPMIEETCHNIDIVDFTIDECLTLCLRRDPLETILVFDSAEMGSWSQEVDGIQKLLTREECPKQKVYRLGSPSKATEVKKPKLKPLPSHLKYEFLDDCEMNLVIVNASVTDGQLSALLAVLRTHKRAIGYNINDLQGISPDFCMHRIHLEESNKPSAQGQRRLNPLMQVVVRKEVQKLLDAGIIYSISDSKWVSPVQVVPNKGCTTVVTNDKNELIATRLVTGWRMYIDYRKLNSATKKDHFPLPYIDQMIKQALISAPIIQFPDWNLPFEIICDASDYAIEAVLGPRKDKVLHSIYYASKTLDDAQINYATTEKELLAVVYSLDKFRAYLVGYSKVIVHTDHATLKYLLANKEAK